MLENARYVETHAEPPPNRSLMPAIVLGPSGTRNIRAGILKTTPSATIHSPIVCTRIVEPPVFSTEIAGTAIGIDALTVNSAHSPRYTVDVPSRFALASTQPWTDLVARAGNF